MELTTRHPLNRYVDDLYKWALRPLRAAAFQSTLLVSAVSARAEEPPEPPNVVVIFVDDMGYGDLGCYGAPKIETPEIDRMANEGMRFTSFYVAAAVCSPSRASLLTGRYTGRNGVNQVYFPWKESGMRRDEVTIAEVLKPRGYATATIGKWHLGHLPHFLPTSQGFDYFYGIPYSNDMTIASDMQVAEDVEFTGAYTLEELRADQAQASTGDFSGLKTKVPLMEGAQIIEYPAHQPTLTRRFFDRAIHFIEENRDSSFFVYLNPTMPHFPLSASEQFLGTSAGGLYGDAVEEIDWNVGRLLDFLRSHGLADNTIVIFASDNGPSIQRGPDVAGSAGPFRAGKSTLYEGGFRVPAVAWGPGRIAQGTVYDGIASTLDLLPTFAAMAGAELPDDRIIDGHDITDVLADPKTPSPYDAFYYFDNDAVLRGVRIGGWKYLESRDWNNNLEQAELYNLADDVGESVNLVDELPGKAEELRQATERFRDTLRPYVSFKAIDAEGSVEKADPVKYRIVRSQVSLDAELEVKLMIDGPLDLSDFHFEPELTDGAVRIPPDERTATVTLIPLRIPDEMDSVEFELHAVPSDKHIRHMEPLPKKNTIARITDD